MPQRKATYRKRGTPTERLATRISPDTNKFLGRLALRLGHNGIGQAIDAIVDEITGRNSGTQIHEAIDLSTKGLQD